MARLKFKTYAENIRVAAQTSDNAQGRPLSIRELSNAVGFSYEHIRKLWQGKRRKDDNFSLSRDCNDAVCEVLGLDAEEMWKLAQQEKFSQRFGYVPVQLVEDPDGRELTEIWGQLSRQQHNMLLQIARGFAGVAA